MVDVTKPIEKVAAIVARSQPNSSRIGGKRSEKDVRALTPIAMEMKATATTIQP